MNELNVSTNMVQYGIWPNCCNACEFCLRSNFGMTLSKAQQLSILQKIRANLDYVDWKGKFSGGVSLLGGELYSIVDKDLQNEFMLLVDNIIEKVLRVSPCPNVRFSTVTNGLYSPEFLFEVIDMIAAATGISRVDMNFSYDLKYRFKSDEARKQVLNNINAFHRRYNYCVGVQMVLAQHVIDACNNGTFSISKFQTDDIPGSQLCFLYPHKVHGGKKIPDFFFKRSSFLNFMLYLKAQHYQTYTSFVQSVKNSALYKYSGYYWRDDEKETVDQQPILTEDKTSKAQCGHSMLYSCYADSCKCMLCDLMLLDQEQF